MDWFEIKQWLSTASGLNMDALHVHAGVLGQILAALMLRRSLASPWPWLAVLGFVLGNEYYDYRYEIWPGDERSEQRAEGIRDAWNTMLVPSLLFLLARFLPRLMRPDLLPPVADGPSADPG